MLMRANLLPAFTTDYLVLEEHTVQNENSGYREIAIERLDVTFHEVIVRSLQSAEANSPLLNFPKWMNVTGWLEGMEQSAAVFTAVFQVYCNWKRPGA